LPYPAIGVDATNGSKVRIADIKSVPQTSVFAWTSSLNEKGANSSALSIWPDTIINIYPIVVQIEHHCVLNLATTSAN